MISIASPHLGSAGAGLAELAQATPLGWFWDQVPGHAKPLRLAAELAPEQPGRFLYWLNRQPHPPIAYLSIVHDGGAPAGLAGQWLVDAASQDLRRVRALRGRARSLSIQAGHGLERADGRALVRILAGLGRA